MKTIISVACILLACQVKTISDTLYGASHYLSVVKLCVQIG